jgi:Tol biopolymer transport system component
VLFDVSGYFALPVAPLELEALVPSANNQTFADHTSGDGRHLALTSHATNLAAGDTNDVTDVYRLDRQTDAIDRVNVGVAGAWGDGESSAAGISDDGRYVLFVSAATNMIPGDTNDAMDAFVRDMVAGTTTRVNIGVGGAEPDGGVNGPSAWLSPAGDKVAFVSWASNLVADDTNGVEDLFVANRDGTGMVRASVDSAGNEADGPTVWAALAADGQHVAFVSHASNLVAGDTNEADDLFVRDLVSGTTSRESVSSSGGQATPDEFLTNVFSTAISADGDRLIFSSSAENLVTGDTDEAINLFVRDRSAGTTTRFDGPGATPLEIMDAWMSRDGSTVVFRSPTVGLSPIWQDSYGDTLYVHRFASGVSTPIRGYDYFMVGVVLDADGSHAVVGDATDGLVPGDNDGDFDSFMLTPP